MYHNRQSITLESVLGPAKNYPRACARSIKVLPSSLCQDHQSITLESVPGPPSFIEFTPVLGILIGIILAVILTALIIMLVMKMRRPSDPQHAISMSRPLHQEDKALDSRPLSSSGLLPVRGKEQGSSMNGRNEPPGAGGGGTASGGSGGSGGGVSGLNCSSVGSADCGSGAPITGGATEDNDPDVIPHKSGKLKQVLWTNAKYFLVG